MHAGTSRWLVSSLERHTPFLSSGDIHCPLQDVLSHKIKAYTSVHQVDKRALPVGSGKHPRRKSHWKATWMRWGRKILVYIVRLPVGHSLQNVYANSKYTEAMEDYMIFASNEFLSTVSVAVRIEY
jgi:hypothetical protein